MPNRSLYPPALGWHIPLGVPVGLGKILERGKSMCVEALELADTAILPATQWIRRVSHFTGRTQTYLNLFYGISQVLLKRGDKSTNVISINLVRSSSRRKNTNVVRKKRYVFMVFVTLLILIPDILSL